MPIVLIKRSRLIFNFCVAILFMLNSQLCYYNDCYNNKLHIF